MFPETTNLFLDLNILSYVKVFVAERGRVRRWMPSSINDVSRVLLAICSVLIGRIAGLARPSVPYGLLAQKQKAEKTHSQCSRIRILRFFSDFKNMTFYVFLK